MFVRSQAMHLSFVMLSAVDACGARAPPDTMGSRPTPLLLPLWPGGLRGCIRAAWGLFCGSIWVFDAAVASVASDAAEGAPVAVCDSASVAMPDAVGPSGEEEHVFDSGH